MSDRTFLDTNILVYAHDIDQGAKYDIARRIIREMWNDRAGIISMQVLQEFYMTVTRKIRRPLSKPSARALVESYTEWCVDMTPAEIAAAFRIEDQARISFWDALILAAAQKSGAVLLLTEDMNSGQKIAGVRIENPFK